MTHNRTFKLLSVMFSLLMVVSFANAMDNVHIGGLVSQGALYSTNYNVLNTDSKNGTFDYTEVMFHAIANPAPKLRVAIQFYSRNLGPEGRFDTSVDYAYMDYRVNNYIGIRAGKVKWDRGNHNLTRDVDMLRNTVFLPVGTYLESFRAFASSYEGAQLYGNLDLNSLGSFDYNVATGKLTIPREILEEVNVDKFHTLKVTYNTPVEGLRFSVTEYTMNLYLVSSNIPTWMKMEYATNFGMEFDWNRLELDAEFMQRPTSQMVQVPHPVTGLPMMVDLGEKTVGSYYVQAGYRILDPLALNFYYEQYYSDWDDQDGAKAGLQEYQAQQRTLSFAARYDINPNWLVKAEVQMNNGIATLTDGINVASGTDEDWMLFALRTTVYF